MRLSISLSAFLLSLSACTTTSHVPLENRTLPFGCNDVVVIGRVTTGAYQHAASQEDVIGHGWYSATIAVRSTVRGARLPSVLRVRYFSHARFRDDLPFMFVLSPTSTGYQIATAQLMSLHPRLARSCK